MLLTISQIDLEFEDKGITLAFVYKRGWKEDKTYFWKDIWCEDLLLKELSPNLYAIEKTKIAHNSCDHFNFNMIYSMLKQSTIKQKKI